LPKYAHKLQGLQSGDRINSLLGLLSNGPVPLYIVPVDRQTSPQQTRPLIRQERRTAERQTVDDLIG
jgi:hypothetical protein